MIVELAEQLRGEAGTRQVEGARLGLAENGGGVIGFDEAVCVVTILERGLIGVRSQPGRIDTDPNPNHFTRRLRPARPAGAGD